jgi:AcrR family transcriptional regulator
MAKTKTKDFSTEEKIKRAAREVFHKKGYAATRTRDIAEAADINLALLNYYFRSKEKLFELIMLDTLKAFTGSLGDILNDEKTTLNKKVELIVERYIETLSIEPHLPVFILSEIRNSPRTLLLKFPIKELMMKSVFVRQFKEAVKAGQIPDISFLHFLVNILSLTIFPFVASPMLMLVGDLKQQEFNSLMSERKKMIPFWIKSMMNKKITVS